MTDARKLDLNLVTVLDALLIERNLTRAGELIGMTQPAVSAALTRLRELFGDPLLQREGRGFTLTPRAEALIPVVAECMADVRRTFDVLPEFDPLTSTRTFVVAASDYVLSEITGPLFTLLKHDAPHTRVAFAGLSPEADISAVDLLRSDVTIAAAGHGVPGKRASLFSDTFVCLVDARNPALTAGTLSVAALQDLRHVRSVFGAHGTTHIDEMLADAECLPSVAVTVQGFLPVPFAVSGTPWVGWVPERTANRYAADLGLVIARTEISPRVLVEAAHWHPSKNDDAALQWLVNKLREASEVVEFGTGSAEAGDGF